MEKAKIEVLNWNKVKWSDYTKKIKNVSFSIAEQISKESFEKYTDIVIDGNDGTILFGKSRVTGLWISMENLRSYEI